MPTYEYECDHCAHRFDFFQSMTEKRLTKCPKCQKESLQRLIGAGAGVIFKGSGFYETDYKKKEPLKTQESKKESPCAGTCSNTSCPANPQND